ncbi:MAG: hypothetical protein Q9160_003944 [Pyrenula sp. 1 TL-2023]
MLFNSASSLLLISSLLSLASATTPEGFTPNAPANLIVTYPKNIQILPPGQTVPRDVVLEAPAITAPNNATPGNWLAFIIDLDVSRNGQKTTLLHMMSALTLTNTSASSTNKTLASPSQAPLPGASYIPPSPPAGSGPHRYVELLFAEPAGFTYPQQFASVNPPADTQARIGFDINAFMQAGGLGEPIAGMYFRVENGTGGGGASASEGGSGAGAGATASASEGGGTAAATSVTVGGEGGGGAGASATAGQAGASATGAAPFTGEAPGLRSGKYAVVGSVVALAAMVMAGGMV